MNIKNEWEKGRKRSGINCNTIVYQDCFNKECLFHNKNNKCSQPDFALKCKERIQK